MKRSLTLVLALFMALGSVSAAAAKEKKMKNESGKEIVLSASIDYSKGKTLMQSLKDRQSSREFDDKALDIQTLSELLWAAAGISREDGRRTSPTAMNSQEIDIYVFLKEGVYIYMPNENKLVLVVKGDKRAAAGIQDYVASAAVNLVYVSDLAKIKGEDDNQKMIMTAVDLGHVSENVYLYCASAGLGCVIRAYVDAPSLSKLLNLKDSQKIIVSQSVGYKK